MKSAEIDERPIEQLCELDRRSGNGIDVTLVWEPATTQVFVGVADMRTGYQFAIEVDPAHALDAFHHPFAYKAADPCSHKPGRPSPAAPSPARPLTNAVP